MESFSRGIQISFVALLSLNMKCGINGFEEWHQEMRNVKENNACARLQINQPQEKPPQGMILNVQKMAVIKLTNMFYVLHVLKLSSNPDMSRLLLLMP